jgi:hypothetical protein
MEPWGFPPLSQKVKWDRGSSRNRRTIRKINSQTLPSLETTSMGLVGELCTWMKFVSVHPACVVSLPSDKFSALARLVRKYVLALKLGYMAAYGSLCFCERLSGGSLSNSCTRSFRHPLWRALGCTVRMRAVLKIGCHSTPGRNLWLTRDAARLTAADRAEKRFKAKARQTTLGIRIVSVLQNRTLPLGRPPM